MSGLALVTGASRGVGRAVAMALARRGFELALLGRSSAQLSEARQQAEAVSARRVREFEADFADAGSLEAAAARVLGESGVPEVVVHSAGVVVRASVEQTSLSAWDEQLGTNLRAPFVLTRALLPSMRAARSGRFVFVGSISGSLGCPGAAAYAASKWGLTGFMKSLAEELTNSGVMACAVLPGSINTDMLTGSGFEPRMSAEEVAKTIEFLAVDASLAHNGSVVEMFGV